MRQKLIIIVIAQFFCTSIWFAGNAILKDLGIERGLSEDFLLHLISAVQIGFIVGTLLFAIVGITDRFLPSQIFFLSAIVASAFNLCLTLDSATSTEMLTSRFFTGFFLAGIYPVGMKIAADHFEKGLGQSLGFLVGGLVLGTAFPHLIRSFSFRLPWAFVVYISSALCLLGGWFIVFLVKDGPFRKPSGKMQFPNFAMIFSISPLRKAILGYWGHMWELYTFWTFVPLLIRQKLTLSSYAGSLLSFGIIASGSLGCAIFGLLSSRISMESLAKTALSVSGICCLLFPFIYYLSSNEFYIVYLIVWGFFVVADSPMFSSLVALSSPASIRGTALTFVNSIGFFITVVSIQLVGYLLQHIEFIWVWTILAIGPILGISQFVKRANLRKL